MAKDGDLTHTPSNDWGTLPSRGAALRAEAPTAAGPASPLTRRRFLAVSAIGLATAFASFALSGCSTSKNIVVGETADVEVDTRLTFFGFKYESINVMAI